MRLSKTSPVRVTIGVIALALLAGACSIQAPDVQFVGQGGQALQPGVPIPTGSLGAAQKIGGGTYGGGTVGGVDQSADTSCKGKSTDVGVSGSTIKLGTTFAISGPVSNISGPIKKGVEAYFNEVNARGGINGRRIQLKYYDDGWDAQKGKGAIKNLVERDKVFVLTTVPSSNGLDAAKTYLESKQIPVFGTSGLIETQFRSPMQWPIGTSSRSASRIAIQDLRKRIGAKNVALVWLDLLAGAEARDAFRKEAAKVGLKIVADRRVGISEPDYGQVWADVKNQTRNAEGGSPDGIPDYVGLLIDPSSALKALRAAQNLGFRPKKGWGGGAPLFLQLVLDNSSGYAADTGLYAGTSFIPALPEFSSIPAVAEYRKTVLKYFSSVDLLNPYLEGGYAGAALTVEALRRAGSCLTRKKVIDIANSLTNYSAAGLTKPLTFSKYGTGSSHYGNVFGLIVQATDKGWKPVLVGPESGWYRDLTPGE
jgi:branched-chain amino acid transport system substrate-binding protein